MVCRCFLFVGLVVASPLFAQELRFDFESGVLDPWAVVEGAFGQPVSGRSESRNAPGQAYPKSGKYFLSTTEKEDGGFNDGFTGRIESPVFVLQSATITLKVGGGSGPGVYVALCTSDGTEVLHARGTASENMREVTWDTQPWMGQQVYLSVVDGETGSWGHLTLDDVVAHGVIDPEATAVAQAKLGERKRAMMEQREQEAREWEVHRQARLAYYTDEARLFAVGEPRVYSGDSLAAVEIPLGGIGAGCILMDGWGTLKGWQILNNYSQVHVPGHLLAVAVRQADKAPVVRVLQGLSVPPFEAMKEVKLRAEYPYAWYDLTDPELGVQASVEAFSPLIPLQTRDSAFPAALFLVTLTNPGTQPMDVVLLATQQNAVGHTGEGEVNGKRHPGYGGNINRVLLEEGVGYLHLASTRPRDAAGAGDMVLAMCAPETVGMAAYEGTQWLHDHLAGATQAPALERAGPSAEGETLEGALSASWRLAPGRSRTIPVVLAWHFPNATHGYGIWGGEGNRYAGWWPNALEVARELCRRMPELSKCTRDYHDALYATNLPRWMVDRIASQVAILRSRTCFWTRDGYFGGWEGCNPASGCCAGNCSHVWHYAQAHARLFPELARAMREQEFAIQLKDGGVPHRQVAGIEPAADGQYGAILGAYREHLVSTDGAWLHAQWPCVKRAMDYAISQWDTDEDGVLSGRQWNTLDDALGGNTSWMGTLYLAELGAAERMARIEGDASSADRYARVRRLGGPAQDAALFNGEYYIQIPDPEPRKDYLTGCHIDQVLGQWWAHQLGLGWVYPREHVETALGSLFRYNFHANFGGVVQAPRKFVADEDAGTKMITWPHGGRPDPEHSIYYGDEVMTGFEYAAAAAMIQAGLLKEGFAMVQAVADRYDGRLRTDLTPGDSTSWGYSGNPFGDDECGKFYARAMSSWSLLLACQGFEYDGPAGILGFHPVWKPEDHQSFFSGAEGWGTYRQLRKGRSQLYEVRLSFGQIRVKVLRLDPTGKRGDPVVRVTLDQNRLVADCQARDGALVITFPEEVILRAGQSLQIRVR